MSTLAERARIEAEKAEAEQPDEEEQEAEEETAEPEPEPELEPEPPAQMTEQQAEREFKKLEKLAETYLPKALAQIQLLGIPAVPCPLCTFPGLAIPREAHEVTSDVEAAVLGLIGKQAEPEYLVSDQYQACTACGGWGEVLTGAKKDISRTSICNVCGGKGYLMRTNVSPIVATTAQPPFPGAAVPFTPLPSGVPDQWGRPAGHPHWGLDPASIGG